VIESSEGINHYFTDDLNSTTLWVIFTMTPYDKKRTFFSDMDSLPGKKLFIVLGKGRDYTFDNPQSHAKIVNGVHKIVKETILQHQPQKTIGFGSSRCAYATLLIGSMAGFDRILAMAPADLILGAPHSLSSKFIANPDPHYSNLIPFIEESSARIDLLLPCFGWRDGFNIRLSRSIKNENCRVHYVHGEHGIGKKMIRERLTLKIMSQVLGQEDFCLPAGWKAEESEISLAEATFDLASSLDRDVLDIPEIDDEMSENFHWFYLKSVALKKKGEDQEASCALTRALELEPNTAYWRKFERLSNH
jgi:hypothetical protein